MQMKNSSGVLQAAMNTIMHALSVFTSRLWLSYFYLLQYLPLKMSLFSAGGQMKILNSDKKFNPSIERKLMVMMNWGIGSYIVNIDFGVSKPLVLRIL